MPKSQAEALAALSKLNSEIKLQLFNHPRTHENLERRGKLTNQYNEAIHKVMKQAVEGELREDLPSCLEWFKENEAVVNAWLAWGGLTDENRIELNKVLALSKNPNDPVIIMNGLAEKFKGVQGIDAAQYWPTGTTDFPGAQIRFEFKDYDSSPDRQNRYLALKKSLEDLGIKYETSKNKTNRFISIKVEGNENKLGDLRKLPDMVEENCQIEMLETLQVKLSLAFDGDPSIQVSFLPNKPQGEEPTMFGETLTAPKTPHIRIKISPLTTEALEKLQDALAKVGVKSAVAHIGGDYFLFLDSAYVTPAAQSDYYLQDKLEQVYFSKESRRDVPEGRHAPSPASGKSADTTTEKMESLAIFFNKQFKRPDAAKFFRAGFKPSIKEDQLRIEFNDYSKNPAIQTAYLALKTTLKNKLGIQFEELWHGPTPFIAIPVTGNEGKLDNLAKQFPKIFETNLQIGRLYILAAKMQQAFHGDLSVIVNFMPDGTTPDGTTNDHNPQIRISLNPATPEKQKQMQDVLNKLGISSIIAKKVTTKEEEESFLTIEEESFLIIFGGDVTTRAELNPNLIDDLIQSYKASQPNSFAESVLAAVRAVHASTRTMFADKEKIAQFMLKLEEKVRQCDGSPQKIEQLRSDLAALQPQPTEGPRILNELINAANGKIDELNREQRRYRR